MRFDLEEEHVLVESAAGNVIRMRSAETVSLNGGDLRLYGLDARRHAETGGGLLASLTLGGDADGLDVPMPAGSGEWLLSISVEWQTDCLQGEGYVDLLLVAG